MGLPTSGIDGSVKTGMSIADFIGSWDFESKTAVKTRGPYIGDGGRLYKVRGGRDGSGSLKGELREGAQAFRRALLTAEKNGTDIPLELNSADAIKVTGDAFIVSNVKIEAKGEDGCDISFDFEANGAFEIEDAAFAVEGG